MNDSFFIIRNAKIIDCENKTLTTSDVMIKREGEQSPSKIVKISRNIEDIDTQSGATSVYNAHSHLLCRAFVDLFCSSFPARSTTLDDAESFSRSAIAGGYSTLVLKAEKEDSDIKRFAQKIKTLRSHSLVRLKFLAPLTNENGELCDLEALAKVGACGFCDSAGEYLPSKLLREAMIRAKALDLPLFLSKSDPSFDLTGINEGAAARMMGVPSTPACACELSLVRNIELCAMTGCRVHIPLVSSAREVNMIRFAKAQGCNISASTAPQYFCLTEDDLFFFGVSAKLEPPLRSYSDREAIIEAIADGTIDCIVSDHTPRTQSEKSGSLKNAAAGALGLESAFPAALTHLLLSEKIDLFRLVSLFTTGAAKVFSESCSLSDGETGDLIIIDPEEETVLTDNTLRSRAHNTPFLGTSLQGGITERFILK